MNEPTPRTNAETYDTVKADLSAAKASCAEMREALLADYDIPGGVAGDLRAKFTQALSSGCGQSVLDRIKELEAEAANMHAAHNAKVFECQQLRAGLDKALAALDQYRQGDEHAAAEEYVNASAHYDAGDKLRAEIGQAGNR